MVGGSLNLYLIYAILNARTSSTVRAETESENGKHL